MKIERLQSPSDDVLDELLDVWERSVRASHDFLTEDDIEFFRPLVRHRYFQAVALYAVRSAVGHIAAFMGVSDDMLEMLFVLPEEQGRGYGKRLIEHALAQCRVYKVDVNEDNPKACTFYSHMGYEIVGRDEQDATGKPFPILHLEYRKNI